MKTGTGLYERGLTRRRRRRINISMDIVLEILRLRRVLVNDRHKDKERRISEEK